MTTTENNGNRHKEALLDVYVNDLVWLMSQPPPWADGKGRIYDL